MWDGACRALAVNLQESNTLGSINNTNMNFLNRIRWRMPYYSQSGTDLPGGCAPPLLFMRLSRMFENFNEIFESFAAKERKIPLKIKWI